MRRADCGHLHPRYRNGRINPKLPFAGSETLAARAAVTPDIYLKSAACESSPLGIHGERASACLMQQLEDVVGNILGLPPCTKQ